METTALTIDELAGRVGMTVRNLREWRTLGLLPAARMEGRVGFYDPGVVTRIESIQRLHEQGFTLELIKRMLDVSGSSGSEVLRMAERLRTPFLHNDPPLLDLDEFARRWGKPAKAQLDAAVAAGVVRRLPDGGLQFTSALASYVLDALHELELPLDLVLTTTSRVAGHAREMAAAFEDVWLERFWEPFVADGMPEDRLPALQAAIAGLRPLALDAVVALFAVAMEERIEQGIAREIARAAARAPQQ